MYFEWRFPVGMEKERPSGYSQEKRQCLENYRSVPFCTTNLWQNPTTFDI